MAGAFKDLPVESDQCMNNAFYITPLNNNKTNKKITSTTVRLLTKSFKLYYVHTLNTYENASGIVLDITTAPEAETLEISNAPPKLEPSTVNPPAV